MEKFKDIFEKWLGKEVDYQIKAIDYICNELDIDSNQWFHNYYLSDRNIGHYSGTDILNDMLEHFIFYISREFEKPLFDFLEPAGFSIYNEPYLALDLDLRYDMNGFYFKKNKNVKKLGKKLNLSQKKKLMENRIFSYIINQTNSGFLSKKEIRMLKLTKIKNKIKCQTE